jgi:hypothetical protein
MEINDVNKFAKRQYKKAVKNLKEAQEIYLDSEEEAINLLNNNPEYLKYGIRAGILGVGALTYAGVSNIFKNRHIYEIEKKNEELEKTNKILLEEIKNPGSTTTVLSGGISSTQIILAIALSAVAIGLLYEISK